MKPLEPWHIIATHALILVLLLLVGRWRKGLFLGGVGIYIIILTTTFAYFEGRLTLQDGIAPVLGVILLAADLTGRLPGRENLFRKRSKSNTTG